MVVESLPVAMRRWRAAIFRCLTILLLAHLHAVQVRSQNEPVYTFSETSNPLRICPVVIPSANPSFTIRPSSNDDAFLIGEYTYPTSGDGDLFRFSPTNVTSCNGRSCTELSIRYNIDSPTTTKPGSFTVNYVWRSGQATIRIDYATQGLYLENPEVVLRPVASNVSFPLDQGILAYAGSAFEICDAENDTQVEVVFPANFGPYTECSPSVSGDGGRPTFLELSYNPNLAMGQHVLYAVAGECSSMENQRSKEFIVSFEGPPLTTTDQEITTTSGTEGTVNSGNISTGPIIGGVLGVLVGVAILVLVTVLGVAVYNRHKHRAEQRKSPVENGAPVQGNPDATQEIGRSNGHILSRPSLQCICVGGKDFKGLDECLAECHDVELRRLDENNVPLIRGIVSKSNCIVYIVLDSESEARPFIKELESLPADENHRKDVFLILFKSDEQGTIERQYYCILKRQEDPSSDVSSCAKTIVNEVKRIRGEHRDFPDGRDTPVLNVNGDKLSGDQNKEDLHDIIKEGFSNLEKQFGAGVKKVVNKVDETKESLRVDIGEVHDEVLRQNGQANANVTVTNPCTST